MCYIGTICYYIGSRIGWVVVSMNEIYKLRMDVEIIMEIFPIRTTYGTYIHYTLTSTNYYSIDDVVYRKI